MSSPPQPPGMFEVKYNHSPHGDTAGCAYAESVSREMTTSSGFVHDASLRLLLKIVAYRGYCSSMAQRVKYIVLPSGVNVHAPSSNSPLMSLSIFSVYCHLPFSSRLVRKMSALFWPVILLKSSPVASFRVLVVTIMVVSSPTYAGQ